MKGDFEEKQEYTLDSALAAARAEYGTHEAPAAIREALRAGLRARRRPWARTTWAVTVLAALLVMGLLVLYKPGEKKEHTRETLRVAALAAPKEEQRVAALPAPKEALRVASLAAPKEALRGQKRRRARVPERHGEGSGGFLVIPYAPPLMASDQLDVFRVRMPLVTAASCGFPVQATSFNSTVTADLVVGGDGIARAVRFIP